MQTIPLTAVPSQTFSVQLNDQQCDIALYQKSTGLFMDLVVNQVMIAQTELCLNKVYMVRYTYLGFIGNFAFIDTQGGDAPYYDGLGTRFLLTYFDPSEL